MNKANILIGTFFTILIIGPALLWWWFDDATWAFGWLLLLILGLSG